MILKRLKEILGEFKGSIKCQKKLKTKNFYFIWFDWPFDNDVLI